MIGTIFVYAGLSSDTFGIYVERVRRSILPPTRDRELVIATRHGVWDFGPYFEKRVLEIDCVLVASDRTDLLHTARSIGSWLSPLEGPKELYFSDESDVVYKAVYSGDLPLDVNGLAQGRFTLPFKLAEPFGYAREATIVEGDVASPMNVMVLGDFAVPFVLTITPAGGDPFTRFPALGLGVAQVPGPARITISRDGKSLTIDTTIASGQIVVIDTGKKTAMKGGLSILNLVTGDFFWLEPGVNVINYEDAVGAGAHLKFEFTPRWL